MADCILRPRAVSKLCVVFLHLARPCWNVNPGFCQFPADKYARALRLSVFASMAMGLFRLFACANFNLALLPHVAKDLCFLRSTSRYVAKQYFWPADWTHTNVGAREWKLDTEGISPPLTFLFVTLVSNLFWQMGFRRMRILPPVLLRNNDFQRSQTHLFYLRNLIFESCNYIIDYLDQIVTQMIYILVEIFFLFLIKIKILALFNKILFSCVFWAFCVKITTFFGYV